MNVEELIKDYLIETKKYPKNRRLPSWLDYKLCITGLANIDVAELTTDNIDSFIRQLAARGVEASVIKDALDCVQDALHWMHRKRTNDAQRARYKKREEKAYEEYKARYPDGVIRIQRPHGTGSVFYEESRDRWVALTTPKKGADGKPLPRRKFTAKTRPEVLKKLWQAQQALAEGEVSQ